jgi:hypothetical protein
MQSGLGGTASNSISGDIAPKKSFLDSEIQPLIAARPQQFKPD